MHTFEEHVLIPTERKCFFFYFENRSHERMLANSWRLAYFDETLDGNKIPFVIQSPVQWEQKIQLIHIKDTKHDSFPVKD